MFLLKLGSKLQNLVKKLQCAMKILTNYKLHFHKVECTTPGRLHVTQEIEDVPNHYKHIADYSKDCPIYEKASRENYRQCTVLVLEKYKQNIRFSLFQCSKKTAFCEDHAISFETCPLNYSNE